MSFLKNSIIIIAMKMTKLELLKLAELQDSEAFYEQDFEENKDTYSDFYDDIKQPNKYIKEDW